MARSKRLHQSLRPDKFADAIKLRCEEVNMTLAQLAPLCGLKPDSIRARLSISRGKRALQPHQVTAIALALGMDVAKLHRLAAEHEGWRIEEAA